MVGGGGSWVLNGSNEGFEERGKIKHNTHLPSHPHHDPNAMDMDAVTLSKLTPVEQAKCMKEGRCFRCRKTRHNTQNCCTSSPSQGSPSLPCPQQIRVTHTQPEPSRNSFTPLHTLPSMNMSIHSKLWRKVSPTSSKSSPLVLKNSLRKSLRSPPLEQWIFNQGSCLDIFFPFDQLCTCSTPQ